LADVANELRSFEARSLLLPGEQIYSETVSGAWIRHYAGEMKRKHGIVFLTNLGIRFFGASALLTSDIWFTLLYDLIDWSQLSEHEPDPSDDTNGGQVFSDYKHYHKVLKLVGQEPKTFRGRALCNHGTDTVARWEVWFEKGNELPYDKVRTYLTSFRKTAERRGKVYEAMFSGRVRVLMGQLLPRLVAARAARSSTAWRDMLIELNVDSNLFAEMVKLQPSETVYIANMRRDWEILIAVLRLIFKETGIASFDSASFDLQNIYGLPLGDPFVEGILGLIDGVKEYVSLKGGELFWVEAEGKEESGPMSAMPNDRSQAGNPGLSNPLPKAWDVFICHASEDKDTVVEPLAKELVGRGLQVWYDKWVLTIGDSLRRKVDEGLAQSLYGIVVISPAFFLKKWTQHELDGLVQKEMVSGEKVILPIWHNVTYKDVAAYSLTLADKVAGNTGRGIPALASELLQAMPKVLSKLGPPHK